MCTMLYTQDKELIAYSILPDVIRAYTGKREYSHFEWDSSKNDYSWISFPDNVKNYTQEIFNSCPKYLVGKINNSVMGNEINLNSFYEHNNDLPKKIKQGIAIHLIEDIAWDEFIRELIDCSQKEQDVFNFRDETLDGKQTRRIVDDLSQFGVYILAERLYETQNIVTDNKWVQTYIKDLLETYYPSDLAEKALSFMHIDEQINNYIADKDYIHEDEYLATRDAMINMYKNALENLKGI